MGKIISKCNCLNARRKPLIPRRRNQPFLLFQKQVFVGGVAARCWRRQPPVERTSGADQTGHGGRIMPDSIGELAVLQVCGERLQIGEKTPPLNSEIFQSLPNHRL